MGIRIRVGGTRRGRKAGPRQRLIASLVNSTVIGAAFVGMSAYVLSEFAGAPWVHEAWVLWRNGEVQDEFAFWLGGAFQIMGGYLLLQSARVVWMLATGAQSIRAAEEHAKAVAAAPWKARKDWAEGRAESIGDGQRPQPFLTILILNVVVWCGAVWLTQQVLAGNHDATVLAVIWLFPLVVSFLLIRALRGYWLRYRQGTTVFDMETVPGTLGGQLAGVIRTRLPGAKASRDGFDVHLSCYRQTVRPDQRGRGRQVSHELVYRDEQVVAAVTNHVSRCAELPIVFPIPEDAKATSSEHVWWLEVRGRPGGSAFVTRIAVPVFPSVQTQTDVT